jgi:DNA-binding response OmpR family regulator
MSLPSVAVVDDDLRVLQIATLEIEDCGYIVDSFSSPLEFLDSIHAFQPSLVLLDLMMPEMNGLECLQRLSTGILKSPVLMFTSIDEEEFRKQALNLGATAYFLKSELLANPCTIIKRYMEA